MSEGDGEVDAYRGVDSRFGGLLRTTARCFEPNVSSCAPSVVLEGMKLTVADVETHHLRSSR